jgi:monothiol glutaredoxin
LIESGAPLELVDVRTDEERTLAKIDGFRLLDQAYHDALLRLDRDTPIIFQCYTGACSQQAASISARGIAVFTTFLAASKPGRAR